VSASRVSRASSPPALRLCSVKLAGSVVRFAFALAAMVLVRQGYANLHTASSACLDSCEPDGIVRHQDCLASAFFAAVRNASG
jgi:hypothetical protein